METFKYGIVLSGGGARGFAHLGVLKALEEKGIKPSIISGVSAGAIIGAFIAAGKSIEETFEIMKAHKFSDLTSFQIPKTGVLSFQKLESLLQSELGKVRIEDLPIPLYVAATDVLNGHVEYFNRGDLSKIVMASASIPVLFSPVKIDESYYVDGGVFNNTPMEPIAHLCDHVIISSISPLQQIQYLGGIMDIAGRTFQLAVNAANEAKKSRADLYIEPMKLREYSLFDTSKADDMFQLGYDYTMSLDFHLEKSLFQKIKNNLAKLFTK
ncbi:patatin-like phospholipase family protein [Zhouia amylolytica]|uniref:patatin-like phospholipase family protein n=1 Tax=Zhouia amylolytica TaxID=376730 RepID=UPI0020CF99D6|nr:patatin-like phospholipase family protein [Zhouia amylolytica]MCQ0112789.1 patatin-like phospholipase family protein [Zhouia amylolytica]